MHRTDIAHNIEWITVLGRAAGAADDLTRTVKTGSVKQTKIVTKLMGVDVELVIAVTPGLAVADVGEARPAAVAAIGKNVEAVLIIGRHETCRGSGGITRVADGGVITGRRHS